MPRAWRETLTAGLHGAGDGGRALFHYWSRPGRLRYLQRGLALLVLLWSVVSLVRIAWSLLPEPAVSVPPAAALINPASRAEAGPPATASVAIDEVVAWHLFGEAGAVPPEMLAELERQRAAARSREGIEEGARETRLALTLRGIVSSDDDGFGFVMIEHRGEQQLYAVGDALPAGRDVVLAKVLPRKAVIDNAGTYELLALFEESDLDRQLAARPPAPADPPAAPPAAEPVAVDATEAAGGLAAQYRQRLYEDPQSLADVVRITAVREQGTLVGYRVSPGKAAADFAALGFEPGDLVTGINGLPLDDPANAVRLYQGMRDAREAVFDLRRDGRALSLSVSLAGDGG